jgi:hypothetical protein
LRVGDRATFWLAIALVFFVNAIVAGGREHWTVGVLAVVTAAAALVAAYAARQVQRQGQGEAPDSRSEGAGAAASPLGEGESRPR